MPLLYILTAVNKIITMKSFITQEKATSIWFKNLNLSKDLTGRVNRVLALHLTHGDLEAIRSEALTSNGNLKLK
jgi:hypothetical protein